MLLLMLIGMVSLGPVQGFSGGMSMVGPRPTIDTMVGSRPTIDSPQRAQKKLNLEAITATRRTILQWLPFAAASASAKPAFAATSCPKQRSEEEWAEVLSEEQKFVLRDGESR